MSEPPPLPPFWAERVRRNRDVAIPRLFDRLVEHAVVDNFRPDHERQGLWFTDSDLFKWMEAAAYAGDVQELETTVEVVLAAQHADGYLNTNFGRDGQLPRWHDLTWSHELYCAGHFVHAAVARARVQGRTDLLDAAERLADCIARDLPGGVRDHHPAIESALVELYRATQHARHLDLAIDLADRVPWRDWDRLQGHAVCALYFATGLTDLALETGDEERIAAVRRWHADLLATSVYITGGVGGRWVAEAIGARYEMPQARSYTETCAAVAAIHWHHRMHALTAEPEAMRWLLRTLHNAFLAGVSDEGDEWFYAIPHATTCETEEHPWIGDHLPAAIAGPLPLRRSPWRDVTCCPTNATRLLAALPHLDLPLAEPDPDSPAHWVRAHHRVESLGGKVALVREPFVYCFEGLDQPHGVHVLDAAVDTSTPVLPATVDGIAVAASRVRGATLRSTALYDPTTAATPTDLLAIPFHAFANRGPSPMTVWVHQAD
ncbi:MAG TPA: beta-L-arabinofuranosidase domain-containing protein [Acidimicrobiia bacterium]|nr:beta-L-arabinofuranosidase domain-containing protein [Acidimicrobiia bacterium]